MVNVAARDAAARLRDPAADRRRHHLPRPHRGQGRRRSTTARSSGSRTPRGRCRRWPRCSATRSGRKLLADVKADYDSLRERHAAKHDRPMLTLRAGAGQPRRRSTGTATSRRRPRTPGIHVLEDYDLAELRDYIDWQPFFNAWEMKGKFPDILNNPTTGETARTLYDDAQADARPDHRREVADRERACSASSRRARSGDDIEVYADDVPHRGPARRCTTCASRVSTARASPTGRWATSSRPARPGCADHVGAFAVTAGLGRPGADRRPSRRTTTTTPRSCSSRSPTGSPRRSPSGCTSGCAPSSGATSPTSSSTTRT